MRSLHRSTSVAALVVGSLWTFSQASSAATVSITDEVFTGNAPLAGTPAPASESGSFSQSVTGGDTPSQSGFGTVRLSPFAFDTGSGPDGSAAAADAPYSVLDAGGGHISTAIYDVNSGSFSLLWGSPDPWNQVTFFSGPNGSGSNLGEFNSANLSCGSSSCSDTSFDLVTFTASDGNIGSVALTDTGNAAFEFGIPASATPLPAALPLFASGLGALGLLGWRRKRKRA